AATGTEVAHDEAIGVDLADDGEALGRLGVVEGHAHRTAGHGQAGLGRGEGEVAVDPRGGLGAAGHAVDVERGRPRPVPEVDGQVHGLRAGAGQGMVDELEVVEV